MLSYCVENVLQSDLSQLLHSLTERVKASTEMLQKLKLMEDQIDVSHTIKSTHDPKRLP